MLEIFSTGDFLVGIGEINKRFILDFMVLKGAFDKFQLSMIVKGRPSFFVKAIPIEMLMYIIVR